MDEDFAYQDEAEDIEGVLSRGEEDDRDGLFHEQNVATVECWEDCATISDTSGEQPFSDLLISTPLAVLGLDIKENQLLLEYNGIDSCEPMKLAHKD